MLGWFASATITVKILLQQLWERKISWDERIPNDLIRTWEVWKGELPALTQHPIPRRLAQYTEPVISKQLHGFCDASTSAYGGVIYLRLLHSDTSVSVSLVTAKTRVAPLSKLTIPRLELCGALLLSKLLTVVSGDLDIPKEHIYAWCDSSVVLGWLNMTPSKLKVFAANRVGDICSRIPAVQWRYVSTKCNPADYASRGLFPQDLLQKELWWEGPPWLHLDPVFWPRRPDINLSRELPELRTKVLVIKPPEDFMWQRYSSFDRLLRVVSWCRRFALNCTRLAKEKSDRLTTEELEGTRIALFRLSQQQTFPDILEYLRKGKELPNRCHLLSLRPLLDADGLLRTQSSAAIAS